MSIFSLFRKKPVHFFTGEEEQLITNAIAEAEKKTSGEVRVYVESRCRFVDPLDRAVELFYGLQMNRTHELNGVLVYVAMKDRQLAIYADEGIHSKVGKEFWEKEVRVMLSSFHKDNYAEGIARVVREIGEVLCLHFPYNGSTDKNELPDEIVFGR